MKADSIMHPYDIRPIASEDADALIKVWKQTWAETYGQTLGQEAAQTMISGLDAHGTAQMMPGTGELGFCALDRTEVVGSIIYLKRGAVAYLWGMYVLPAHQRSGVGSKLLQAVTRRVGSDVRLEVRVQLSSPHAKAFYIHHGFRGLRLCRR